MARILYMLFAGAVVRGGHKMITRHVATLRGLGFDACVYTNHESTFPEWLVNDVPVLRAEAVRRDDVLVVQEDSTTALEQIAKLPHRALIFTQNPNFFAPSFDLADAFFAHREPRIIAVSPGLAATASRAFPAAKVEMVPCFVDERVFRPGDERTAGIAFAPRKRPSEFEAIRPMFRRFHARHAGTPWRRLDNEPEAQVARVLGASSLFLSLSRLESVGLMPLEAMASGALCAGFLGVGGREFATEDNGFWAPDEDCEAAADALARAADLAQTGGAELQRRIEAGRETATRWSYAVFREALEQAWMRIAPDLRLKDGPLD